MEDFNSEKLIITAGVIIIDNGKLLLVKRDDDKKTFPGAWTFPGGKLEKGESLKDCAIRECIEEANIRPKSLSQHSFHEFFTDGRRIISHLFSAKISGTITETDKIKLFSFEALKDLEVAFDNKNLMVVVLSEEKSL